MSEAEAQPTRKRGRFQMSPMFISFLLLALIAFYVASLRSPNSANPIQAPAKISGMVTPIDGDTVWLNGKKKRIWGIDAPDPQGTAGEYYQQSTEALTQAASYQWTCEDTGEVSRDRDVSKCVFTNGAGDIGEWMVRAGYAVDWPEFSGGAYANAQRQAQHDQVGIWQTHDKSWR